MRTKKTARTELSTMNMRVWGGKEMRKESE